MVLELAGVHLVLRIVCWVMIQVWEEDSLRVGGLDMLPRTAVAMAASADFVVEGAVNLSRLIMSVFDSALKCR